MVSATPPFVKMVDEVTKKTLAAIPLLKTKAGPRDGDAWVARLKEEYLALIKVWKISEFKAVLRGRVITCISIIQYVSNNKEADNDWFRLESNKEGTR